MHSQIYEGIVQHRRMTPLTHAFRYRLWMLYLDLSELDIALRGRWLWSTTHSAVVSFRRADHVGDQHTPLDVAVRDLVEAQTGQRPNGPIRLLTQLRHFGYIMNPVCFYYCFDANGRQIETVVAEVTNTPWGERHCYVLPFDQAQAGVLRYSQTKAFHVSPFMGMDQTYAWRIGTPGENLNLHIQNFEQDHKLFDATLVLRRRPINGWQLAWVLCRYPFMTVAIIVAIYWQAFVLWLKKCPAYPHPRTLATPKVTAP